MLQIINLNKVVLILVFVLAFSLRFYHLGQVPGGFHADEAALSYNAYSLLQTGKDEYGKSFPLLLKSFGDFKPALYSYLDIPFIKIFGLNEFAARFPSALFGSLTILSAYLLIVEITKKKSLALIACLLLAINPWHINLSRTVSETVISTFFITIALLFVYKGVNNKKIAYLIVGYLFFLLTIITYIATNLLVPLLVFVLLMVLYRDISKIYRICLLAIPITLFLISFLMFSSTGFERLKQVNIFSNPGVQLILDEQLREDGVNKTSIASSRMYHNKIVNFAAAITKNYFSYFTRDFLFLSGGLPKRASIPGAGNFYLFELPFLLYGLYLIIRWKNRNEIVLLIWLFITPVVASITFDEVPNLYRTLFMVVPFEFIVAKGIIGFIIYIRSKSFIIKAAGVLFILIALYNIGSFFHQYLVHLKLHQPWNRHYGYKELVFKLNSLKDKYKEIVITKSHESPYIFFLFYGKYDPLKYQQLGSPRDLTYSGFDKYRFIDNDCPVKADKNGVLETIPEYDILFVDIGECKLPESGVNILETIYREDKTVAFMILDYQKTKK